MTIFDLNENVRFKWVQLILHSIPRDWKSIIKQDIILHGKLVLDHHLNYGNRLVNDRKGYIKEF